MDSRLAARLARMEVAGDPIRQIQSTPGPPNRIGDEKRHFVKS